MRKRNNQFQVPPGCQIDFLPDATAKSRRSALELAKQSGRLIGPVATLLGVLALVPNGVHIFENAYDARSVSAPAPAVDPQKAGSELQGLDNYENTPAPVKVSNGIYVVGNAADYTKGVPAMIDVTKGLEGKPFHGIIALQLPDGTEIYVSPSKTQSQRQAGEYDVNLPDGNYDISFAEGAKPLPEMAGITVRPFMDSQRVHVISNSQNIIDTVLPTDPPGAW